LEFTEIILHYQIF